MFYETRTVLAELAIFLESLHEATVHEQQQLPQGSYLPIYPPNGKHLLIHLSPNC